MAGLNNLNWWFVNKKNWSWKKWWLRWLKNLFKASVFATIIWTSPVQAQDQNNVNTIKPENNTTPGLPVLLSEVENTKYKINLALNWAKATLEEENYRLEWEIKSAINNIKDVRLRWQLQMFFDYAKQYWAYISYEKWKDISNFSIASVIKIEWWYIKISGAFLQKVMQFDFSEFNKSFNETTNQSSFWVDFKKDFNHEMFKEATISLVRNITKNKDFWKLWNRITDNPSIYEWIEVYGWVRWATATEISVSGTVKVSDTFKFSPKFWLQEIDYNDIWYSKWEKQTNPTFWAEWVYQTLDNKTQLEWNVNTSKAWNQIWARLWHKFEWWVEWFIEWYFIEWRNWVKDNKKIFVWVNIPLWWGKSSKYPSLYKDYRDKWQLTWSDLTVNPRVVTEQLYVQTATWGDRIVYIDKTSLATGDSLDKNADWTLKSLLLDNGWFNITSINTINDNRYSPYIQVIAWQLAIVDFKWLNDLMKSQWFQTGQTKNLRISVNDTSWTWLSIYNIDLVKWSVEIKTKVERLHNVLASLVNDFINGSKTFFQVKDLSNNLVDTLPTLWAPTLESKTTTTINTTPGTFTDVDWVQNVTTKIYSDAWFTTLVWTSVNWDFSWLTPNTTYYIRTEWEAKNWATWNWEIKTTPWLTVTTETVDTTPPTLLSYNFSWLTQWTSFSGKTMTFNEPIWTVNFVRFIDDWWNFLTSLTWVANNTNTITVSWTAPNVSEVYIEVSVKDLAWNTITYSQSGDISHQPIWIVTLN